MTEADTMRLAVLGVEAQAWLNGALGRYVVARAQEQIEEAQASLLEVDAADAKAVAALQRRAREARDAVQWLLDAVQDGEAAQKALIDQDDA